MEQSGHILTTTYFIDFFSSFLGLADPFRDPGMCKTRHDQQSFREILILTQRRQLIYRWGGWLLGGRCPIIATLRLRSQKAEAGGFLVVSGHDKTNGEDEKR